MIACSTPSTTCVLTLKAAVISAAQLSSAKNTNLRAVRVECSQLTLDNLLSKITAHLRYHQLIYRALAGPKKPPLEAERRSSDDMSLLCTLKLRIFLQNRHCIESSPLKRLPMQNFANVFIICEMLCSC
jgi:hypothetical protein